MNENWEAIEVEEYGLDTDMIEFACCGNACGGGGEMESME